MDNSLSEVPFLEEVTSVFLMTWMDFWEEDHLFHKICLPETLVDQKIVFLMHSSMTTLTGSLEDLETSSQSCGVVGVPLDLRWPVAMSVMHTYGVDLFFITLDTIWSTNIISEKPGFSLLVTVKQGIVGDCHLDGCPERRHPSLFLSVERRFHFYCVYLYQNNEIIII